MYQECVPFAGGQQGLGAWNGLRLSGALDLLAPSLASPPSLFPGVGFRKEWAPWWLQLQGAWASSREGRGASAFLALVCGAGQGDSDSPPWLPTPARQPETTSLLKRFHHRLPGHRSRRSRGSGLLRSFAVTETSGLLAASVLLEGSGKVSAQSQGQQGGQKEGGRDPRPAHLSSAARWLSGCSPSRAVRRPPCRGWVTPLPAWGGQNSHSWEPPKPNPELLPPKPLRPHWPPNGRQ